MTLEPITPADRARARAALVAAATGDTAMLVNAVADAADDERDQSIHTLVAALAEDAVALGLEAAALSDASHEDFVAGLRISLTASVLAASSDGEADL